MHQEPEQVNIIREGFVTVGRYSSKRTYYEVVVKHNDRTFVALSDTRDGALNRIVFLIRNAQ